MLYADYDKVLNELQVNGRDLGDPNDNDTANTDYTAGDDNNENDQNDNPADSPDDYTVPDQGEDQTPEEADNNTPDEGTEADAGADGNQDDGGGGEDTTDYTDSETNTGDEGGGDEGNAGGNVGGGDTGGGDPGGGDDAGDAGDEGGDNTDTDDGGGDMSDDEIKQLEDDLFSKFNDQQIAIMTRSLKQRYLKIYDVLDTLIERVNDTPKEDAYISIISYVTNQMADMRDMIDDYLTYTFGTKSYIENQINYKRFCVVLRQINSIISQIYPDYK